MLPFGSCSPAVAEVGSLHYQIYGTSEDVVGLTAEIFLILYIPMNYPVVWVLDNWGVRFSVSINNHRWLQESFSQLLGVG